MLVSGALAMHAAAARAAQAAPSTQIGTRADLSEGVEGRLRAKILVTPDLDGFWKAWEGPTPPNIVTTGTIRQAKPVFAIIVFGGCTPGAAGRCKLSVTFGMTAPDGKPYSKDVTASAYEGPGGEENLLASAATFGFRLEPKDKLGEYRMKATLTDEIAQNSVTVFVNVLAEGG